MKKPKKTETDSATYKKLNRKHLRCSICPPNRGENATRKAKHGVKKPKYKNKRK